MPQVYTRSFYIALGFLFLLPLFFVPGDALSLSGAKSSFLSIGIAILALAFLYESYVAGMISFPKHYLVGAVALLPVIYLLSALLATPSSLSLLGYNFEVGTFGFILLSSLLLVLTSAIFSNHLRVIQGFSAVFVSLSILALFLLIKIGAFALWGKNALVFGNFPSNIGNPLGSWTDLAIIFGMLSLLITFSVGVIPMKRKIKALLYASFVLALALLVILNFSTAWALVLAGAIFSYLYFSKVEKQYLFSREGEASNFLSRPTFLPIILGVVSLIFFINPSIPGTGEKLGVHISNISKVSNTDVRPSLGATLSISKAVLSENSFLGSGPNTFGQDWLIFKPLDINSTPFWSVAFPFGIGFVPTQIATTGVAGTLVWLAFFASFVWLGARAFTRIPDSRGERFALVSSFTIALFLWVASFVYVPSATVLIMAFVFTGVFVASCLESGIISAKTAVFTEIHQSRIAAGALAACGVGIIFLGWTGLERTVAAYHFEKAVRLSSVEGVPIDIIERGLEKAIKFSPVDIHFLALSRLSFAKAQVAANLSSTSSPQAAEQNRVIFQESLAKSVESARKAVDANPAGYGNWVSLGRIYGALVPAPLSVEGAYENARFAYAEALKRNPNNPELPLLLAQLELANKNIDAARSYIRNAIALKEDYADAYLMLAQLEISQNNVSGAIQSTQTLSQILPNNPGVFFELGVLKYSSQDYKGSLAALERVLALSPNYANAKYYLALTLVKLNREQDAKLHLEELLAANPDNAELKEALEELE